MTKLLASAHIEKLGVAEVMRVCANARMVFRPVTTDDVGVDGFLELLEDGIATGMIAGVQIKSGDSFVDKDGLKFRFVSDQPHFGYWARCAFPVVGVVFSPKHNRSVWLDLTSLSSDERIVNGPYSIGTDYDKESAFSPENLAGSIAEMIRDRTHQRRTVWQIQELLQPKEGKSELSVPRLDVSGDKEKAWYELTENLLSPISGDEEIIDAGYRLSWYFPAVSSTLQEYLQGQLALMPDSTLVRLICVVNMLIEDDQDSRSELVVDLISYLPKAAERVERLLEKNRFPSQCREAAIQVIETLSQKFRDDLRVVRRV